MINKIIFKNPGRFTFRFRLLARRFGMIAAVRIVFAPFFRTMRYKHDCILSYLEEHYSDIIDKYRNAEQEEGTVPDNCVVWVCWFQGEALMPESVRYCLESIRKHSGSARVQLVTSDNYRQFANLPRYIVDNKHISLTHFSDILRSNLLADHGGIWIDAALLLTGKLQMPPLPFFSIKLRKPENDDFFVSDYRWLVGFMGGSKGNVLHSFLKDFFNAYCRNETGFIDYFLADYAIAVAYRHIPSVTKMIDDVPYSNEDFYYMKKNLFQTVDRMELEEVLKRSRIFYIGHRGFPQEAGDTSLYSYLFKGGLGKRESVNPITN